MLMDLDSTIEASPVRTNQNSSATGSSNFAPEHANDKRITDVSERSDGAGWRGVVMVWLTGWRGVVMMGEWAVHTVTPSLPAIPTGLPTSERQTRRDIW